MRRTLPLLAVLLLAGCAGYLRPMPLLDGDRLVLLLAGKRLNSPSPETFVLAGTSPGSGGWKRLAGLAGAARSAALWRGQLWLLFEENISVYGLDGDEISRVAVHDLKAQLWRPDALAVHGEHLWCLGRSGAQLMALRRAEPAGAWEAVPTRFELGRSAAFLRAAGGPGGLWLLWRKREESGAPGSETFTACWRDGEWQMGRVRSTGPGEFAVAPDPAGEGVLVVSHRRLGTGPAGARQIVLWRVSPSGWSEERVLDVPPRQFGSAVIGLGLLARKAPGGADELVLFVGRRAGVGIYRCEVEGRELPARWSARPEIELDVSGPETLLSLLLFLCAVAVGAGLGLAAVRRRRLFPLLPGQPRPAPLPARAGAWLIDNGVVTMLFYAAVLLAGPPLGAVLRRGELFMLLAAASRLLFYFYATVFEARWGATPGKLAFGLRVATLDGHRPTARSAVVRNGFRLLDEALIFPLPGMIMVVLSRHAQRLGDVFAGTLVSTAGSVDDVHEDRRRKSDRFGLP